MILKLCRSESPKYITSPMGKCRGSSQWKPTYFAHPRTTSYFCIALPWFFINHLLFLFHLCFCLLKSRTVHEAVVLRALSHGLSDQVRPSVFQADLIEPSSLLLGVTDVSGYPPPSDPIHQKHTYGGPFFRPEDQIGWKWTGVPFPSDFSIEESGTLSVSSLHSGADTDLLSTCSAGISVAIPRWASGFCVKGTRVKGA